MSEGADICCEDAEEVNGSKLEEESLFQLGDGPGHYVWNSEQADLIGPDIPFKELNNVEYTCENSSQTRLGPLSKLVAK